MTRPYFWHGLPAIGIITGGADIGTTIGAVTGMVLFALFGLLPAFRLGSYLALFILRRATGKPVEATVSARAFILAAALLCLVGGAALSLLIGAWIGSFVLL